MALLTKEEILKEEEEVAKERVDLEYIQNVKVPEIVSKYKELLSGEEKNKLGAELALIRQDFNKRAALFNDRDGQ
jgi:hypothetical protein